MAANCQHQRTLTPEDVFEAMHLASEQRRQYFRDLGASSVPVENPLFSFPLSSNSVPSPRGGIGCAQLERDTRPSPAER